jgi:hypothetical protein
MISSILYVLYRSLQIICGAGRKLMQGLYDPYAPQRNPGRGDPNSYDTPSGSGAYSPS